MLGGEFTSSQIQLLKARATKFLSFRQQKFLSIEHGLLVKEIDPYLAYGLLRHGYDENLPKDLSASVFVPFNKCLTICMQNGVQRNKECCEVCDSIGDLTRHASGCVGHPEACPTCKSFYNLLHYHLVNCYTCDMHLCTKLKLKLLKYQHTEDDGLMELWPKIQQYISRLFPMTLNECFTPAAAKNMPLGKQGLTRYPSVFDSISTPPASPSLVARGDDHDKVSGLSPNAGANNYVEEYYRDMDTVQRTFDAALNIRTPSYVAEGGLNWGAVGGGNPASGGDGGNMSTDFSSINSLSLNSLETKLKVNDGYGSIIKGEPRQLRQLAAHWSHLKKRLKEVSRRENVHYKTPFDGVILQGTNSNMNPVSGQYKKNEQWRKITYVGGGVAGKCYLAVDTATEAQFAVKKIDLLKYEADELELWSELEHPNLVQLYGAMRVRSKVYIFSEFYAAGNVAEFIDTHTMLDQWLSLWFLQQLLDALTYLKKKNVLHEDIKADNIFLKPDSYKIGLGDFGLSRRGRCPPNVKPVGGQHHWSPEKAKSQGHGYAADVWAANCTFIHMLSGEPPWRRRFAEILFLHFKIATDSPPVEDIPENLLIQVDTLVRKAWNVNEDDRPTATDLLKEECFQILYEGYQHTDPVFRSHIPTAGGEDEMEYEGYETSDSHLSIDYILEGMDDKEDAVEYLNQIVTSLDNEDSGISNSSAASSSSAAAMRRQYSTKAPRMESIVEEIDGSLEDDGGDEDMLNIPQKDVNGRAGRRPVISPLMLPKRSASPSQEKRHSWGSVRSSTSPSPSNVSESDLFNKRDNLRKRETSPAIIVSVPVDEGDAGLLGEKDIFDLHPSSSGYITASVGGSYMADDGAGMSLTTLPPDRPLANQGDLSGYSSSLYESFQPWLGSSGSMWTGEQSPYSPENRMSHIALKPDSYLSSSYGNLEEKFDLSSSLKILRDSLPSASSIDPRSILTIVNGLTQLDDTEVLIKGNETWQEIIEQNIHEIKKLLWDLDGYTYYLDTGLEVTLSELVPREKTNVYIFPTKENSTWQVSHGRIVYAPTH